MPHKIQSLLRYGDSLNAEILATIIISRKNLYVKFDNEKMEKVWAIINLADRIPERLSYNNDGNRLFIEYNDCLYLNWNKTEIYSTIDTCLELSISDDESYFRLQKILREIGYSQHNS